MSEASLPEWARYLLSIIGVIGTILLGYIAKSVSKVVEAQVEQGSDIKLVRSDLANIIKRVSSLEEWRTRLQDEKIAELKSEIRRIKDVEHTA